MKNILHLACFMAFALLFTCSINGNAQLIYTIAGNGSAGFSYDGIPATSSKLNSPRAVSFDVSGNMYIADWYNNRIRIVNTSGIINTFAGNGTAGYTADGIAATASELNQPADVAVDASGNVYIADRNNNRVRKVTASGTISTIAGTGSAGYTADGIAATASALNLPWGVAVDGSGNVYIADGSNNRVRKVNTSGIITTIAGGGVSGYTTNGIAATASQLDIPISVAVDVSGNIYIACNQNHLVRKVNTSGIISTIAGNGTGGYNGDGIAATAATLNYPSGVSVDTAGNVFISDGSNARIRKVNTSGIISTFAGGGAGGYTANGIPATAAQFSGPGGVHVDVAGNVFISTQADATIRKVAAPIVCPPLNVSSFGTNGSYSATGYGTLVSVTSSTLANGTYTVTYNLSAPNLVTGSTATMVFSGGTGTFTTSTLTHTGNTTITITGIAPGTGGCTIVPLTAGNTATYSVNAAPAGAAGPCVCH